MKAKNEKHFIIFGGAGFLGQHLTRVILESFPELKVVILDLAPNPLPFISFNGNDRVEFRYGRDITDPVTYKKDLEEGADALFNLAGFISFWSRHEKKMFEVNVEGVRRLCEATLRAGIPKLVHISSVAAVGFTDNPANPADEKMTFQEKKYKNRIYMFSKYQGENMALSFASKGMEVVSVNPGLLYGPGEKGAVLTLFRNISTGRLKFYPTGGTGIVDVRDAAKGAFLAFLKGENGERYILNGHNLSFREITTLIAQTLGKKQLTRPVPRISRIPLGIFLSLTEGLRKNPPDLTAESFEFCFRFRYYSSAKAENELGWKAEILLEKTIVDTVDWYQNTGLL
jgi:dihydroflavonol-4-reductase